MKLSLPRVLSLTAVLAIPATVAPAATGHLVNVDGKGVILDGHDAVAFFTDHRPVPGLPRFQSKWNDAIYHFATAEHKALFDRDPAKYEPQFGAFCAYAVSRGRTAPIDVDTFSIVDGRLVVQHNAKAVRLWNESVSDNLRKADKYWPRVIANAGKQIEVDEGDSKD
jgi:YHS domain-containing protein